MRVKLRPFGLGQFQGVYMISEVFMGLPQSMGNSLETYSTITAQIAKVIKGTSFKRTPTAQTACAKVKCKSLKLQF